GAALVRGLLARHPSDVSVTNGSPFVSAQLRGARPAPATDGRSGSRTMESEATLIQGLRRGDAAALEALMERHAPRVYRVAFGITRSAPDAEEVVQDVFTSLVRAIGGFEGRSALGTWLYRVATNAALARRRGQRTQVELALHASLPTS